MTSSDPQETLRQALDTLARDIGTVQSVAQRRSDPDRAIAEVEAL